MKKRDLKDLKKESAVSLYKKLKDLQKEKIESQISLKLGKIKNVHEISKKKKDIAQINTLLNIKTFMEKTTNQLQKKKGEK